MESSAIIIESFTKCYGRKTAVEDLSLEVPRGSIFGFLGRNGAGKSTTIKALMNLVQPTSGRLSVLGLDSRRDSVLLHQRVGYVPEEPAYYNWMTVEEILSFNAAFYERWDRSLAGSLLKKMELPSRVRLRELSLGMRSKVGLIMALGSRPEVLILDDPTSGLDTVVRHEFLESIIANVQAEGGTVLFSSHLLHEIERVADEVAIVQEGHLLARASLDQLKSETKKLRAVYPGAVPEQFPLSGLIHVERDLHQALLTLTNYDPAQVAILRSTGAESVEVLDLSLEEIFVETVKGGGSHV